MGTHVHPALFLFGPADGKRMFVDSHRTYHAFAYLDSPRTIATWDEWMSPTNVPVQRITYVEVDRIEGTRIFAPSHERYCPGEVRQRLLAGYQGEGRHGC